ncbi:hypothetical protein KXX22_000716 [Aspergillus fumigatus]|nr:hypothetical protein KXX22_000716 [Aspergillus fumigatus]KAH2065953.1 hypothetical protein KXW21_005895 [Aspergillus fumigatus]KAH2156128.1 hypothetical protein KXW33_007568 [Aspergillus fumigatus]KAH2465221.1 hypothetical protein KXW63_005768 [Aspergillus fumigatus]KAH2864769.1 hypothetical protein KXV67_007771 [Aspergillus fumigatus]
MERELEILRYSFDLLHPTVLHPQWLRCLGLLEFDQELRQGNLRKEAVITGRVIIRDDGEGGGAPFPSVDVVVSLQAGNVSLSRSSEGRITFGTTDLNGSSASKV